MGTDKKHEHEWYSENKKSVSVIRYQDKRKIILISAVHHGSEMDTAEQTCNNKRQKVQFPKMVKQYSNGEVGVDARDQGLRNSILYVNNIRLHG